MKLILTFIWFSLSLSSYANMLNCESLRNEKAKILESYKGELSNCLTAPNSPACLQSITQFQLERMTLSKQYPANLDCSTSKLKAQKIAKVTSGSQCNQYNKEAKVISEKIFSCKQNCEKLNSEYYKELREVGSKYPTQCSTLQHHSI